MHGVAAKVAKEVGVLLKDGNADAGSRQQITQHNAGGAAAGDDALGGLRLYRAAAAPMARTV